MSQVRGTPPPAPAAQPDPERGIVTPEELAAAEAETEAKRLAVIAAFGDEDEDAAPEAIEPAKKAVAKRLARKAPAVKRSATGGAVTAASDAWFAPLDETSDFVNVLYWGREGATKTTSAATAANIAPEGSKVLFINAEGGLKIKALKKHGVDTSKIVIFPDPKSDDTIDDETLERVFLRVQADLIKDQNSWYAVVFDSLTDIGQRLTDQAQERRTQKLLAGPGAATVDPNFVDRDDYGVSAKIIRKNLRRWRDLPCHFIVTALERRDVDEDTNEVSYGPAVAPAVATDLLGYVDFALFCRAGDGAKPVRALTKEGGKYRVKDRLEVLPKVFVEPTFDRLMDYFNDTLVESEDAFQESLTSSAAKAAGTVAQQEGTPTK